MVFLEEMREKLREAKKHRDIHMMPFLAIMENIVAKARQKCLKQNRSKKRHYESKKQRKLLNSNYNNKATRKLMATVLAYSNRQHCIS